MRSIRTSGTGASPRPARAALSTVANRTASAFAAVGTWWYGDEAMSSRGSWASPGYRSRNAGPSMRANQSAATVEPYLYLLYRAASNGPGMPGPTVEPP
jgi:hypothetical protein